MFCLGKVPGPDLPPSPQKDNETPGYVLDGVAGVWLMDVHRGVVGHSSVTVSDAAANW